MKKNKAIRILTIMLLVLVFLMLMHVVKAAAIYENPKGVTGEPSDAMIKTQNIGNQIIGVAQIVATGIAIIMLVYMAIKYISAAPSEKAEIKKGVVLYVVGAVLLFAATGILQIIKGVARQATDTMSTTVQTVNADTKLG